MQDRKCVWRLNHEQCLCSRSTSYQHLPSKAVHTHAHTHIWMTTRAQCTSTRSLKNPAVVAEVMEIFNFYSIFIYICVCTSVGPLEDHRLSQFDSQPPVKQRKHACFQPPWNPTTIRWLLCHRLTDTRHQSRCSFIYSTTHNQKKDNATICITTNTRLKWFPMML